jgi:hypothetical protein
VTDAVESCLREIAHITALIAARDVLARPRGLIRFLTSIRGAAVQSNANSKVREIIAE